MRINPIALILLFTGLVHACKVEKNTDPAAESAGISAESSEALSFKNSAELPAYNTVVNPQAPRRISRNVKLTQSGDLLIAAYDDVIRFDGTSFSPLEKTSGLASWYAFDALEDAQGNIWVASDQSGAYRIDATSGEITHFTPEHGLGHLRNMVVYEDRSGTIWIGGQGGLSKFNGESFETYTTADGLPHNDINTLMEDRDGNLWIGTRGNAGIFDGKQFKELKNDQGQPFFNSWSIMQDKAGTIWLVDNNGLWQYKDDHFSFLTTGVWKILQGSNNNYFLTAIDASSRSQLKQISASALNEESPEIESLLQSETMLFGLVEDLNGNLWIGGGDGVWRYKDQDITYFTGNLK